MVPPVILGRGLLGVVNCYVFGGNGAAPVIGDGGVAMPARCAAVWARGL